ncbi:MAG: hypothetical protein NTU97_03945 [Candidatus Magasanikbacteria bacterium]|nr:hypothetical protein [Candidatus Magasanikbacteria bacterium]
MIGFISDYRAAVERARTIISANAKIRRKMVSAWLEEFLKPELDKLEEMFQDSPERDPDTQIPLAVTNQIIRVLFRCDIFESPMFFVFFRPSPRSRKS